MVVLLVGFHHNLLSATCWIDLSLESCYMPVRVRWQAVDVHGACSRPSFLCFLKRFCLQSCDDFVYVVKRGLKLEEFPRNNVNLAFLWSRDFALKRKIS